VFQFNKYAQNKHHKKGPANQLGLFCEVSTSEMHENHYCQKTGGMSAYGSDFKYISSSFVTALVDHVIGNWIHVT